jgi:predicted O-methyltransferase YrrM
MSGARVRPVQQLLPEVDVDDFLSGEEIRIEHAGYEDGAQQLLQLVIINSLCRRFHPERLFEFGTFRGRTTLNLAANSPDGATVFTLDLPRESLATSRFEILAGERGYVSQKDSRRYFHDTPCAAKIVQLFGDSATFDYRPYVNSMDFIFIDASHSYDAVMNDSRRAMEMLRGGHGVILWDDYDGWYEGLTRAVAQLYTTDQAFREMKKIRGTQLVYLQVGGNGRAEVR